MLKKSLIQSTLCLVLTAAQLPIVAMGNQAYQQILVKNASEALLSTKNNKKAQSFFGALFTKFSKNPKKNSVTIGLTSLAIAGALYAGYHYGLPKIKQWLKKTNDAGIKFTDSTIKQKFEQDDFKAVYEYGASNDCKYFDEAEKALLKSIKDNKTEASFYLAELYFDKYSVTKEKDFLYKAVDFYNQAFEHQTTNSLKACAELINLAYKEFIPLKPENFSRYYECLQKGNDKTTSDSSRRLYGLMLLGRLDPKGKTTAENLIKNSSCAENLKTKYLNELGKDQATIDAENMITKINHCLTYGEYDRLIEDGFSENEQLKEFLSNQKWLYDRISKGGGGYEVTPLKFYWFGHLCAEKHESTKIATYLQKATEEFKTFLKGQQFSTEITQKRNAAQKLLNWNTQNLITLTEEEKNSYNVLAQ